ncbi:HSCB C-terminal oligomerization domain-containing protein [Aspergillus desertorum]
MASFSRAHRALQRLAVPFPLEPAARSFHTTTRKLSTPTFCILCRLRPSRPNTSASAALSFRLSSPRTFASTPFTFTDQPSTPESPSTATATTTTPPPPPPSPIPNAPNTNSYYTIFSRTLSKGPPPSGPFTIDLPSLRREFFSLQNTLHPDKYPPGPTKAAAESLSAVINEAYRTLSDPLLRAQYLLREFHGIDVTAEDGSGAGAQPLDPELLMEVMDVQEAIEEVGEGQEAVERIGVLKRENDERVRECVEALAGAFDKGDVEGARGECVRLKFWVSVAEGLKEWEPGMGGIRLIH